MTCRVRNPDIPRAGFVGAHGGVAGRDRAGLFANRIVRLGNNPSWPSPLVEFKTRTYHGRVGSGRPAERPEGVGQDWVPTKLFAQVTKVHRTLQSIEDTSLQRLPRSTNNEIPRKPTEKPNQRLTRSSSAVYQQGEKRLLFMAADQYNNAFCLCKPFSCKAYSEITTRS